MTGAARGPWKTLWVELMPEKSIPPAIRAWTSALGVYLLALAALLAIRFVNLEADAPPSLWTVSAAVHVDEGYKTLGARNLNLFGASHWNDQDDYPGWTRRSPITQLGFYSAFQLLGQRLSSARIVTIAWFFLMIVVFTYTMKRRYHLGVVLLGLAVLGLNHTLYSFSRLALFEVPITCLVFIPVFLFTRYSEDNIKTITGVTLGFLLLGTFGVKASTLLYFLPVLAALGLVLLSRAPAKRVLFAAVPVVITILALAIYFRGFWTPRLAQLGVPVIREWLANPLAQATPLLVAAGLFAAGHSLLLDWRRYLRDPYKAALLALMIGGPLLLAQFRYNPLRYYIPILPTYPLLILEWLADRNWKRPIPERVPAAAAAAVVGLMTWGLIAAGIALNRFALNLALPGGASSPEFVGPVRVRVLVASALAIAALLWSARRRLLRGGVWAVVIVGLLGMSLAHDVWQDSRFLLGPDYSRQQISAEIAEILPRGASVAGEWAPLFAIGTDLKALYMNRAFNRPTRINEVRPEFVLVSSTFGMKDFVEQIAMQPGVAVEESVYESEYAGRRIELFPVRYSTLDPGLSSQ